MQHAVDKIIFLTDWSYDQSVKKKTCQNHVAANLTPDRYDIWDPHTFASQGFVWEGLPNQLGIHHIFWPGLCLGGPTESTWNPPTFSDQGFAWKAYRINLESTVTLHFAYLTIVRGKGTRLANGHPIQCYVGDLG